MSLFHKTALPTALASATSLDTRPTGDVATPSIPTWARPPRRPIASLPVVLPGAGPVDKVVVDEPSLSPEADPVTDDQRTQYEADLEHDRAGERRLALRAPVGIAVAAAFITAVLALH